MNVFRSASIVGALVVGIASQALAAPMIATFSGTADGTDVGGYFGSPGVISGASFSGFFVFDTTLGNENISPGLVQSLGGSAPYIIPAAPSPITAASLTINGQTITPDLSYFGQVTEQNFGQPSAYFNIAVNGDPSFPFVFFATASGGASGTSESMVFNSFRFGEFYVGSDGTDIFLTPTAFSVTAVPEPLTLGLFGIGLAGVVRLRRLRKANA